MDTEAAKQKLFSSGVATQIGRVSRALESYGRSREAVAFLTESLFVTTSSLIDRSFAMSKPACRAGCSFCCQVPVLVTPLEAMALGRYVDERFSAEERDALIERLRLKVARFEGATRAEVERDRSPCALLSTDGRCQAYEARPVACRAASSFSVERCREAAEHPEEPREIESDANALLWGAAVVEGLRRGLGAFELDSAFYELSSALLFVLTRPDAESAWLQGSAFSALCSSAKMS